MNIKKYKIERLPVRCKYKFYKLSQIPDILGVLRAVLKAIFYTTLISPIYGLIAVKVQHPFFNTIFSLVYCIIIAMIYYYSQRKEDNRNTFLSLIGALIVWITIYYFGWVSIINFYESHNIKEAVINYMKTGLQIENNANKILIYFKGWGGLKKEMGDSYIFFAVIEIILYFFMCFGTVLSDNDIYCEKCHKWLEDRRFDIQISPEILSKLKDKIYNNKIKELIQELKSTQYYPYLDFTLYKCDTCNETNIFTLEYHYKKKDSEGKESELTEIIIKNLIIPYEEIKELEQKLNLLALENK